MNLLWENYILSDKREESLISIIPGSESDIYLQIIKAMEEMEEKKIVPNNLETLIAKLSKINTEAFKETKLKYLLKAFDLPDTDPVKKDDILKDLLYFILVTFSTLK